MEKTSKKPKAKIVGQNGNTLVLLGICQRALKGAGQNDKSDELRDKVWNAKSYKDALRIMAEYCDLH